MRAVILSVIVLSLFSYRLNGQTRIISGRVVSEYLEPLPYLRILKTDSSLIGKTDLDGRFRIAIPQNASTLTLNYIGFEQTVITLSAKCDTVEAVMMYNVTYDFISLKKVNRLRLKRFKKIPALHLQAYQKGFFTKATACYSREFYSFEPYSARHHD